MLGIMINTRDNGKKVEENGKKEHDNIFYHIKRDLHSVSGHLIFNLGSETSFVVLYKFLSISML
jgi:hypothetical protein